MKLNNQITAESKVGTKTKQFSKASSMIWNTKRRYK